MHPPSFHLWKLLCRTKVLQFLHELEQEEFATVFEDDTSSAELNIGFYLMTFLEKSFRVAELEIEIVIVGVWAEADLLDDCLDRLGLDLFLLAFLLVDKLVELDDPANGWICIWGDHDEVKSHLVGPALDFPCGINVGFYIPACRF